MHPRPLPQSPFCDPGTGSAVRAGPTKKSSSRAGPQQDRAATPRPPENIPWAELEPAGLYAERLRPLLSGLLTLIVLLPVLALMAVVGLVLLVAYRDPRKVLFVQTRMGHRRRPFELVKFRTMSAAPESDFASWGAGDQPRVTRLGRFLRSTHLDELPQIVNVLRGEMDLIGPRPEMLEIEEWAEQHVSGFHLRLAIKPGITGPAQITQGYTGREVDAYRKKLHINLDYLDVLSFRADLTILLRTVAWVVKGKGWAWKAQARRNERCGKKALR